MNEISAIILGAGASKPYGLPLGSELRDLVLSIRTHDPRAKLLSQFGVTNEELRTFQGDLQMSAAPTVDAYLETRPSWMKIGKIATAIALDRKEDEERLFPPNQPKDHWYQAFWHALNCGSWSALKKRKLRVITFNYDRTLECYLCGVIANNFGIKRQTAAQWLAEEFIIRPHGTLGKYQGERLHWLSNDRPGEYERVKSALESIVVISEANPTNKAFKMARSYLSEADTAVFLGFGYHKKNMERLGFPELCGDNRIFRVHGSHKGVPRDNWRYVCHFYFKSTLMAQKNWPTLSKLVSDLL